MTIWQGGLIILATVSAFPALHGVYRKIPVGEAAWLAPLARSSL